MRKSRLLLSLCFLLGHFWVAAQPPDCFSLKVTSDYALPGEQVCVDVQATGFQDILGMQFSMSWDSSVLQLEGITNFNLPGLSTANFGPAPEQAAGGVLTVSWFESDLNGATKDDGSSLFTLCFTFIGQAGSASPVLLTDRPTAVEFFRTDDTLIRSFALISGRIRGATPGPGPDLSIESVCSGPEHCGSAPGYATAIAADGTAPYSFYWEGRNGLSYSGSIVSDLAAGVYLLKVSDQRGDTLTALVYNQEAGLAIEAIQVFPASCPEAADGRAAIDVTGGSGGFRFLWSDGQTGGIASALAPGGYTVTVTDSQGCTLVDSITVPAFDTLPVQVSLVAPTCGAANGSIDLSLPRPADSLYTIAWSHGDTVALADSLAAGSYSVTVTDERYGCSTSRTFELIEESFLIDLFTKCRPSGSDTTVDIKALVTHGGIAPYTFNWSNGAMTTDSAESTISVNIFGTYSLTVTDFNGCSSVLPAIRAECFESPDSLLGLTIGNALAAPGEEVCIPVSVRGFNDVAFLRFSIAWNPDALHFEGVDSFNLSNGDTLFGYEDVEAGILHFTWGDGQNTGVSIPDDSLLFTICFTALDSIGDNPVTFSDQPLPPEAFSSSADSLLLNLVNGRILIGDTFIWPGDTDDDGTVNHFDLLPVGLAYGAQGPPRANASIEWLPQPAPEWAATTPSSGTNFNHADSDGTGWIDAGDTLAIRRNWNLDRSSTPWVMASPRSDDGIPLFVAPQTVASGQPAAFDIILGEADQPATDVYGLAFTIVYDTSAIHEQAVNVDLTASWFGSPGNDLLVMQRNQPDAGRLDIAITRIDQANRSGNGSIGQLRMTIEDVILIRADEEVPLPFHMENVRVIDANEEERPVDARETVAQIRATLSGIDLGPASRIRLYPNPADGELNIDAPGVDIKAIELFTTEGRRLRTWNNLQTMDISGLPHGIYLLRLITLEGVVTKRVVKR